MALEIERKFLVDKYPEKIMFKSCRPVQQGYIMIEKDFEIRISNHLKLTIKKGNGLVREEVETKISEENFTDLWVLTEGKRVEKTRLLYVVGDYLAEFDFYQGGNKGLMTVEVEFPNVEEANAFMPPEWFGAEVTGNYKYKNSNLAK